MLSPLHPALRNALCTRARATCCQGKCHTHVSHLRMLVWDACCRVSCVTCTNEMRQASVACDWTSFEVQSLIVQMVFLSLSPSTHASTYGSRCSRTQFSVKNCPPQYQCRPRLPQSGALQMQPVLCSGGEPLVVCMY